MNPADERSRLALSRVLSSAGRDADAQRALQDTLRVIPASARAHWWLATSYERVNRFADARQEFEQAASKAVAGRSHLLATVGRLASGAADGTGAIDALTPRGHRTIRPIRRGTGCWRARSCSRIVRMRRWPNSPRRCSSILATPTRTWASGRFI